VLNSLAQEKLQASIRCLAEEGSFLEIGKFDIVNGTKISLEHFKKGISFKPVFLDDNSMNNMMVRISLNKVKGE
jgi:fatty acid synthase